MSKVMIKLHDKDNDVYELYTDLDGGRIIWAVVDQDMLLHIKGGAWDDDGLIKVDIENMERELSVE